MSISLLAVWLGRSRRRFEYGNGRGEIGGFSANATAQRNSHRCAALEKYTQDRLLGEVWKRAGLAPRDRSIVTLAALIARNQTIEMPYHVNLALDNGVKSREISEIITHLAFYSGWANAMSAVAVAKDVFADRKTRSDQIASASPQLLPLDEAAEAQRAARVGEQFGSMAPGVVQYTADLLFRDLWLRPDLAPRDRSLVTVSALIASGQVAHGVVQPRKSGKVMWSGSRRVRDTGMERRRRRA
jgi:alkylhydroperoxidase/carboxymuconolactone decarboxylase family protein YurZ